jgi:hemoglobin/transferrin/lactoferrin receptor protein
LGIRGSFAINAHFLVQAGVENLADRNYRTFASGVSAPGRNVQLSLRATF